MIWGALEQPPSELHRSAMWYADSSRFAYPEAESGRHAQHLTTVLVNNSPRGEGTLQSDIHCASACHQLNEGATEAMEARPRYGMMPGHRHSWGGLWGRGCPTLRFIDVIAGRENIPGPRRARNGYFCPLSPHQIIGRIGEFVQESLGPSRLLRGREKELTSFAHSHFPCSTCKV